MVPTSDTAAPPHRIVLVGDPDWDSRAILTRALDHAGYDVHVAEGGDALLAAARATRPDLIIAEIYVPCAEGRCTVQCLKTDAGLRHVPVLVYTSRVLAVDEEWARSVGADQYLRKPARLDALLRTVAELLPLPDGAPSRPAGEVPRQREGEDTPRA